MKIIALAHVKSLRHVFGKRNYSCIICTLLYDNSILEMFTLNIMALILKADGYIIYRNISCE